MLSSRLDKLIKSYRDFPKEGILFRDLMPIFADPQAFSELIESILIDEGYGKSNKLDSADVIFINTC